MQDNCSSGYQSAMISNFPSALPSSASTSLNEYSPQPPPQPPPPPPPPQPQQQQSHAGVLPPPPPPLLPDIAPSQVVDELCQYISNESDKVVLTNSVGLLFSYSIQSHVRGPEVCELMSASPVILDALYNLLTSDEFKDDDPLLFLATGNLTNISKYDSGRMALLNFNEPQACQGPSRGVRSLVNSLQSRDSNVVIFAITAVHNLLLDRRTGIQEMAKRQIIEADGIKYIVRLLAHPYLMMNFEFKVIVLDCLQILAYGSPDNRLAILENGGTRLLLKTIEDNFNNQPSEELVETASRVLKSLSVCSANKTDIIKHNGIELLTRCISRNNQEILKTCLWTLRNLSDVINNHLSHHSCMNELTERLLSILYEHSEEPRIVTCTLGILANLTCNNESIKQFICARNGVTTLLNTIGFALRDGQEMMALSTEILEPAIYTLCHIMNQAPYPGLEVEIQHVMKRLMSDPAFKSLEWAGSSTSEELAKAVDKLKIVLRTKWQAFS